MAKTAYYAVRRGRETGIYSTWAECEANVKGYAGAEFKKFSREEDATAFINQDKAVTSNKHSGKVQPAPVENTQSEKSVEKPVPGKNVDVYVDGSFNSDTNDYGYGVYMTDGKNQQIIVGRGQQKESGRNVEGEVAAASAALSALSTSRYDSVTVYHDYQGIGSWADRDWKANKGYTKAYADKVAAFRDAGMNVTFKHVDGHTGNEGNEYVDKLAKVACGVGITPSERDFISQLRDVKGYPADAIELQELPVSDDFELT